MKNKKVSVQKFIDDCHISRIGKKKNEFYVMLYGFKEKKEMIKKSEEAAKESGDPYFYKYIWGGYKYLIKAYSKDFTKEHLLISFYDLVIHGKTPRENIWDQFSYTPDYDIPYEMQFIKAESDEERFYHNNDLLHMERCLFKEPDYMKVDYILFLNSLDEAKITNMGGLASCFLSEYKVDNKTLSDILHYWGMTKKYPARYFKDGLLFDL